MKKALTLCIVAAALVSADAVRLSDAGSEDLNGLLVAGGGAEGPGHVRPDIDPHKKKEVRPDAERHHSHSSRGGHDERDVDEDEDGADAEEDDSPGEEAYEPGDGDTLEDPGYGDDDDEDTTTTFTTTIFTTTSTSSSTSKTKPVAHTTSTTSAPPPRTASTSAPAAADSQGQDAESQEEDNEESQVNTTTSTTKHKRLDNETSQADDSDDGPLHRGEEEGKNSGETRKPQDGNTSDARCCCFTGPAHAPSDWCSHPLAKTAVNKSSGSKLCCRYRKKSPSGSCPAESESWYSKPSENENCHDRSTPEQDNETVLNANLAGHNVTQACAKDLKRCPETALQEQTTFPWDGGLTDLKCCLCPEGSKWDPSNACVCKGGSRPDNRTRRCSKTAEQGHGSNNSSEGEAVGKQGSGKTAPDDEPEAREGAGAAPHLRLHPEAAMFEGKFKCSDQWGRMSLTFEKWRGLGVRDETLKTRSIEDKIPLGGAVLDVSSANPEDDCRGKQTMDATMYFPSEEMEKIVLVPTGWIERKCKEAGMIGLDAALSAHWTRLSGKLRTHNKNCTVFVLDLVNNQRIEQPERYRKKAPREELPGGDERTDPISQPGVQKSENCARTGADGVEPVQEPPVKYAVEDEPKQQTGHEAPDAAQAGGKHNDLNRSPPTDGAGKAET
eukprot:TRINITY_DN74929_c0_g1_i1.p1 TRINITY_DN74929_c0_g1~~TRINITY_DN74929_c0_g1_i1.p1  ORF type:complete len:668 (-),score=130.43 TRINITY_DN74929_c0_g1_i1:82-2085(-)